MIGGLRDSRKRPLNTILIKGNNIDVIGIKEPNGEGIIRKINSLLWLFNNYLTINSIIKNVDIVHSMIPGDIGLMGLFIALRHNKFILVRHCGTWGNTTTIMDKIVNWILPKISKKKILTLATGYDKSHPNQNNKNIKWIFSTSISQKEMDSISVANQWNGSEPIRLVTVCRLTMEKNVISIISALSKIKKQFPDAKLSIIGDGKERSTLESFTRSKELQKNIIFYGNLNHEDVMRVLSRSHVFIFPTNTKEGFPKVLIEAMANGLPSIASNISVIPTLINNNAGIVLKDTKPDSIADAILNITSDLNKMREMGAQARKISQNFTLEKWSEQISDYMYDTWKNY